MKIENFRDITILKMKILNIKSLKTIKFEIENKLRNQEKLINYSLQDLKPENILVTVNNRIKLGDFGLACLYVPNSRKTYSHQVFTRWYRAPELLFGSITYDPKVDIWACGCILAEYINGSPLFLVCFIFPIKIRMIAWKFWKLLYFYFLQDYNFINNNLNLPDDEWSLQWENSIFFIWFS